MKFGDRPDGGQAVDLDVDETTKQHSRRLSEIEFAGANVENVSALENTKTPKTAGEKVPNVPGCSRKGTCRMRRYLLNWRLRAPGILVGRCGSGRIVFGRVVL